MDPNIAAEFAMARHAEMTSVAARHQTHHLTRTHRPARRVTLTAPAAVLGETTAGLRARSGQLLAQGSSRQATLEPCC